ncbi:MAG: TlpA disulfide reductase family protein [Anaerolineales bacterium]|nr:TlpA disulfide reductase family protein [Anaerolineales bacterium]
METLLLFSSLLLWVLVLLNLLLTLGLARRMRAAFPRLETLKVGQRAPDFTARTLNGETVTLAAYARRPVAFVFVSPDCQPCREALPRLQELRSQAQQFGVELILVSDAAEDKTLSFVEGLADGLPVLVAPRERTSFLSDYKAMGTPSYCLLDAQGKVRAAGPGLAELGEKLRALAHELGGGDGMEGERH